MTIFWNIFFWLALVAIVSLVSWTTVQVVSKNAETRKYIADAQNGGDYKALAEQSEVTNGRVLESLGSVNVRLAAIEKTLTEIP